MNVIYFIYDKADSMPLKFEKSKLDLDLVPTLRSSMRERVGRIQGSGYYGFKCTCTAPLCRITPNKKTSICATKDTEKIYAQISCSLQLRYMIHLTK